MQRSSIASLVAGVSTIVLIRVASGAELPTPFYKAPPPPAYSWTGFYAGLNAGWGTANHATTTAVPVEDGVAEFFASGTAVGQTSGLRSGSTALANVGRVNENGFIGGGQIGYNWQVDPRIVLGVEADIQGADIRGSGTTFGHSTDTFAAQGFVYTQSASSPSTAQALAVAWGDPVFTRAAIGHDFLSANLDWMGTVRGRAGYLLTPNLLVYATGGLAYGGVKASTDDSLQVDYSFTSDAFALAYGRADGVLPIAGANGAAGPHFAAAAATASAAVGSAATFAIATNGPQAFTATTHSQSFARVSDTRAGGSAGAGFEWMASPEWSFKAEALYYNLGSVTVVGTPLISSVALVPTAGIPSPFSGQISKFAGTATVSNVPVTRVKFDGVILRAGVNYHFNWGG